MVEFQTADSCELCKNPFSQRDEGSLPICDECRESLLKRHIPKPILYLVGAIFLFSLLMLHRLPNALNTAISFERGERLAEAHRYMSAEPYFETVAQSYPNYFQVLARQYEAYYHNAKLQQADELFNRIITMQGEPSKEAVNRINTITGKIEQFYYPHNDFESFYNGISQETPEVQIGRYEQYCMTHPEDLIALYYLTDLYFLTGHYEAVESKLEPMLEKYPDWKLGYYNLVPAKRELLKIDEARHYYNKLIEINLEDGNAYVMAAKVELKTKNSAEVIALSEQALQLLPENGYAYGLLSVAYHDMGDEERSRSYSEQLDKSDMVTQEDKAFFSSLLSDDSDWR